jgi:hypothetical protein
MKPTSSFASNPPRSGKFWSKPLAALSNIVLLTAAISVVADQVEMHNGDRYVGQVLSMSTNTLSMQNDVLGTVTLPREKIARVTLGEVASGTTKPAAATNTTARITPQPSKISSNLVQQIHQQYLAEATPEAKAKYNELASGLLSGKLSVADIRVQAKSAAEQLRKFKADLGDDAGDGLEIYLAILDSFLDETKSLENKPATSTTGSKSKTNLIDDPD